MPDPALPHSNEYIVAHAVCPWCAADVGEWCDTPFAGGVHAARHMVVHLPTLEDIEAGRRLREGFAALGNA